MEAGAIIELSVKEIDDFVFVAIFFDNGAGMTEETKEALLTASPVFFQQRDVPLDSGQQMYLSAYVSFMKWKRLWILSVSRAKEQVLF
ncbi:hypothetical protein GCM10020331_083610 [Ectobacillus funiculus]